MASTNLSNIVGGGSLPSLAPDLTFPSAKQSASAINKVVVVATTAGVLTTTLSLTGKFDVSQLNYTNLIAEAMTHKLTIDGVVIWNDVGQSSTSEVLMVPSSTPEHYQCNSSFVLEINTLTDTSVTLVYMARPIL